MVVQRLCRVQLVPRLYVRIGQAERLPGQIKHDRHKPTYREIDELPDTNISGVTCLGHARNLSNTRSAIANSKQQIANTPRPSPLINLEVEYERLFLDQKIIIKIIITRPLIIFPSEAFDGIDVVPEG
jgi:hypothetical protein